MDSPARASPDEIVDDVVTLLAELLNHPLKHNKNILKYALTQLSFGLQKFQQNTETAPAYATASTATSADSAFGILTPGLPHTLRTLQLALRRPPQSRQTIVDDDSLYDDDHVESGALQSQDEATQHFKELASRILHYAWIVSHLAAAISARTNNDADFDSNFLVNQPILVSVRERFFRGIQPAFSDSESALDSTTEDQAKVAALISQFLERIGSMAINTVESRRKCAWKLCHAVHWLEYGRLRLDERLRTKRGVDFTGPSSPRNGPRLELVVLIDFVKSAWLLTEIQQNDFHTALPNEIHDMVLFVQFILVQQFKNFYSKKFIEFDYGDLLNHIPLFVLSLPWENGLDVSAPANISKINSTGTDSSRRPKTRRRSTTLPKITTVLNTNLATQGPFGALSTLGPPNPRPEPNKQYLTTSDSSIDGETGLHSPIRTSSVLSVGTQSSTGGVPLFPLGRRSPESNMSDSSFKIKDPEAYLRELTSSKRVPRPSATGFEQTRFAHRPKSSRMQGHFRETVDAAYREPAVYTEDERYHMVNRTVRLAPDSQRERPQREEESEDWHEKKGKKPLRRYNASAGLGFGRRAARDNTAAMEELDDQTTRQFEPWSRRRKPSIDDSQRVADFVPSPVIPNLVSVVSVSDSSSTHSYSSANASGMAIQTSNLDTIIDADGGQSGLMVTGIENSDFVRAPQDLSKARDNEDEVENNEYKDSSENWFLNLHTSYVEDITVPQWIRSRVKIFRSVWGFYNGVHFRLWIERENSNPKNVQFGVHSAELVPLYAYRGFSTHGDRAIGDIYLRAATVQDRVGYKFDRSNPNDTTLYSFQGGLLSSFFEREYPVEGVIFYPAKRNSPEYASSTIFQIWTEKESLIQSINNGEVANLATTQALPTSLGKKLHTLDLGLNEVAAVKMFFFVGNKIYVLFISDHIELAPLRKKKSKSDKAESATLKITPRSREYVKYLPVAILPGTKNSPAGIPLDHKGIRFEDQNRDDLFHHYNSVEITFHDEDDCKTFKEDFNWYLAAWRVRCRDLEEIRRKRQVPVVSTHATVAKDEEMLSPFFRRSR